MKLELKNVSYNPRLSEETYCFSADLIADGKMIAVCKNSGHGGNTDIKAIKGYDEVLEKAREYTKAMPPIKVEDFDLEMDLELYINGLMSEYVFEKMVLKPKQKKNLITGKNRREVYYQAWHYGGTRTKIPIEDLLIDESGRKMLEKAITESLKEGEEVFNTNIPKEFIESVREKISIEK